MPTPTRLYAGIPPTVGILVYTAPADGMVLTNMHVVNTAGAAKTFALTLAPTVGVNVYLFFLESVVANRGVDYKMMVPLAVGDRLFIVQTDAALPLYVTLSGIAP